ncbi:MAG: hypothetical protein JRH11_24140, partial [Deltaproteobacteria bacterium]|nr:hypothetical protein [Deltaproteobacteria bacterium]
MRIRQALLLLVALATFALGGCSNADGPGSTYVEPELASGKADWAPITVEHGDLKLTLEPEIVPTSFEDGTPGFALRGRTNRYMDGGGSYLRAPREVEAQAIGLHTQRNRQAFDVIFTRAELTRLLSGEDLVLTFDPQRDDLGAYAARVGIRGRTVNFRGGFINAMHLLRPVVSDGQVRHRLEAAVEGRAYSRSLFFDDTFIDSTAVTESNFFFDVSADDLIDAVSAGTPFEISGNGEGDFAVAVAFIYVSQTDRGAHA